jgi:hypothetical protein
MIIVSVKAPAPPTPPPAKCTCTVAEVTVLKEPVVVVKPPDAEVMQGTLEVKSIEVKPADVRSDITLSVSVSVTVS